MNTKQEPPLAGIKVLELARILAGPWCGQVLADLGADVVKVERSVVGDDTRSWGPPFLEAADGTRAEAAYYHGCNRGKRCVEADFETPEGREIVRRLAAHADVLIENFKVGGLARFGLDYESLRAINPKLIYCSITGFGQTGPYAPRAGYDFLIQGMGGAMQMTGEPDGQPMKSGIAITDIFTGLYAANAIQAALIARARTGQGTWIDCALLDTQVSVLGYQAMNYFVSGKEPARYGNGHPNIVPYDALQARDGTMLIACGNDSQFRKLVAALGEPELADDPVFATNEARVNNRARVMAHLESLTRRFDRADILPKLETLGVPAGAVNKTSEVFDNVQVRHRHMRLEIDNPRMKGGKTPGLRSPVMFDGVPAASPLPAPGLGQHTDEVLADKDWFG